MDMLKKLRERIDWLDSQIASLLNERMRAADQIGRVKKDNKLIVTDKSREKSVLDQVEMIVQHPVLKTNIANIYGEIMKESRTAQQFYQSLSFPFRRIGIVGVGLIGGSICKGIKMKDPAIEIGTIDHPSPDVVLANEGGWIDKQYSGLAELVKNSELIILASPISTIIPFAEEIKRHCAKGEKLLVMDVAGVKGNIVRAFEALSDMHVEYIGTHPMAGKEMGGFANSQATLFVSRPWVVAPHARNSEAGLQKIYEVIRYLGSEPLSLQAAVHDRQAALVSHLPMMLAKSYFDFVVAADAESLQIAGPGFQSFTRLSHSSDEMCDEIKKYNQKLIQEFLSQWFEYLKKNKG